MRLYVRIVILSLLLTGCGLALFMGRHKDRGHLRYVPERWTEEGEGESPEETAAETGALGQIFGTEPHKDRLQTAPENESKNQNETADPQSGESAYNVEKEQQRRQEHLEEACSRLGLSRDLPPVSWESTIHFIVSDARKLLFCFVPKVSCTTWKATMSDLYIHDQRTMPNLPRRPQGTEKRKYKFLKMVDFHADERGVTEAWKTYAKVMFARDPLERALSAYLDKFVYGDERPSWERNFGSKIIKRYRSSGLTKRLRYPLQEKIRFDEFIRFITDNGPLAKISQQTDHWLPVSRITDPCRFRYDFIGHYETLKYDAPYVLERFNLSRIVTFPEVHSSRSNERLLNAYADVPVDLIHRLVDYYKNDYELFGYSANKTLDMLLAGRGSR